MRTRSSAAGSRRSRSRKRPPPGLSRSGSKTAHAKACFDPEFAAKVCGIAGLYVDPPAHAIVLSVDEKSQIQALDRIQPELPLKKGRAGTTTHDYKRHGAPILFAALDVLEGKIIGRCMRRHRHQAVVRFLNAVEAEVPSSTPSWTTTPSTSTP